MDHTPKALVSSFAGLAQCVIGSKPIDEIIPGFLWLGNLYAAKSQQKLDGHKITHILGMTQWGNGIQFFPGRYVYKIFTLKDEETSDIAQHFQETFEFIDSCLQAQGRVFVHCNLGISRSASVVIAYIMKSQRLSFTESLQLVREQRPVVQPNAAFQRQLLLYEVSLFSEYRSELTIQPSYTMLDWYGTRKNRNMTKKDSEYWNTDQKPKIPVEGGDLVHLEFDCSED